MINSEPNKPTELSRKDVDLFFNDLLDGKYDLKPKLCMNCGTECFINYGYDLQECDECFFARWPKEQRDAFYRSFFE